MTRAEAAAQLRSLRHAPCAVGYGTSLDVAIRALEPATRKRVTKNKTSVNMSWFLRQSFPVGVTFGGSAYNPDSARQRIYKEVTGTDPRDS